MPNATCRIIGRSARLGALLLPYVGAFGAALNPGEHDFFERKIRPVFVAECYDCHGSEKQKGGLRLDSRSGWQSGGESGPVVVPGHPEQSLLITAIKHLNADLEMPGNAPKLPAAVIADFEQWVKMGAPDPRDAPSLSAPPGWSEVLAQRRNAWSLQPLSRPSVPASAGEAWSSHPVDRFLLARMTSNGLTPVASADPRSLLRRLTFLLVGLPPSPDEVAHFLRDFEHDADSAVAKTTERLLASPHFGEHWARHWLDLVRYAETHGSEGDPAIIGAWRYRDYLIRALNADVPLDQLIREHIAGDLLPNPRINSAGFNESMIGPSHLRFVEHGFQPVDTLDDQVKAIDNQIDVVSKAFQALTISCARCHDHRFDAVSQRDYTALYGIFASVRPAQVTIDTPEALAKGRPELAALKGQIKAALAGAWLLAAAQIGDQMRRDASADTSGDSVAVTSTTVETNWTAALIKAGAETAHPLHPWARLRGLPAAEFAPGWRQLVVEAQAELTNVQAFNRERFQPLWNLAGSDLAPWFRHGVGLQEQPVRAGEFSVQVKGPTILTGLAPAGVFTPLLSDKDHGLLMSPRFTIETDSISIRVVGGGFSMVRVIVDNYPLPQNPIFPKAILDLPSAPRWIRLDTAYRKGSSAYLEFGTRDDLTRPLDNRKKGEPLPEYGRSFFGVEAIVAHNGKVPPREEGWAWQSLLEDNAPGPASAAELADLYQRGLERAITSWASDRLSEAQRALLDYFVRGQLLPVTLSDLESTRPLVERYRVLESQLRVPQRVPGVIESAGFDAPLYARGDHLKPQATVPRGYLEVLDSPPYRTPLSGRLNLADAIASPGNPLTARVMANRVWQWVFGVGLVPTVDNFGRMGEAPTHPELLDFLAARLIDERWSLKTMIRLLVATRAFQMGSTPSPRASEIDPGNSWLSHQRVRRLGAEAIRDALLGVSGELLPEFFGPPVKGDLPRRSIYVAVRRTNLDPFLQVFDAPSPFSTLGRRDATNVPAQSLALLNSPLVVARAAHWAKQLVAEPISPPAARVEHMFQSALGRPPGAAERAAAVKFVTDVAREHGVEGDAILSDEAAWQELAHSIFNLKEFIYVR